MVKSKLDATLKVMLRFFITIQSSKNQSQKINTQGKV